MILDLKPVPRNLGWTSRMVVFLVSDLKAGYPSVFERALNIFWIDRLIEERFTR